MGRKQAEDADRCRPTEHRLRPPRRALTRCLLKGVGNKPAWRAALRLILSGDREKSLQGLVGLQLGRRVAQRAHLFTSVVPPSIACQSSPSLCLRLPRSLLKPFCILLRMVLSGAPSSRAISATL